MMKKKFFPGMVFAVLLGGWELLSHNVERLRFILPPPSAILYVMIEHSPRLLFHSKSTCIAMTLALVYAISLAFPCAWCMATKEPFRKILEPIFLTIQSVPMFVITPLIMIWFGSSLLALILPTMLMILFPLTLNLYRGFRSVPQALDLFFDSYHASPWQKLIKLQIPYSLQHFFSGCRLAATIAGLGTIAAEWLGAQKGLGIVILESRRELDIEMMFAAIACVLFLTVGFYYLIILIEKLSNPKQWHAIKKNTSWPFFISIGILLGIASLTFPSLSPPTKKTTLLLDWLPNPNHIPLYVGQEKGFFKEESLFLDIRKLSDTGGSVAQLTSKQSDIILYNMSGALKAYSRGAHIKTLGYLIKEPLNAFIIKKDPSIKTLSDLSMKRLGYCVGSHGTSFLDFLLEKHSLHPQVRHNVNVDLVTALISHRVDYIYGGFWNIEPHQLKQAGIDSIIVPIQDLGVPKYYEMVFFIRAGSKEDTSFFKTRFQKALQQSIDFCKEHPQEAFSIYLRHNPHKRKPTQQWEKASWNDTLPLLAKTQDTNFEEVDSFYTWLQENHLVTQRKDLKPFLE